MSSYNYKSNHVSRISIPTLTAAMTVLRTIAIISSLFIISVSSAPPGFEFGIKSKVYFGRDDSRGGGGFPMPSFNVKMPGFPFNMKAPRIGGMGANQLQQFPLQMTQKIIKMGMALVKPAIDSGMTQQVLGGVI